VVSDKATGALLLIIGLAGILLYGYLLFFYNASMTTLILQITAFLAISMILGIIAWIGYTMATTPPPEPLDIGEVPETTSSPEPKATEEPETTKD
jgi:predicted DNA-binding transcriptional regulator